MSPTGGMCAAWRTMVLAEPPSPEELERLQSQDRRILGVEVDWCPGAEAAPPSPDEVAQEVVRRIPLPAPSPRVEPGRMLVGLRAYLESGQAMEHTFSEDTVLGSIAIVARPVLHVDWGDGTVTGPHHDPGGPHPDGTITHVYRHPGTYTITVTATWTAEWAVAGQTGTIGDGLTTVGTIEDFPVEERQAVITHR